MKFLIVFFILSIINVIFSTARSIVTIKGGKMWASLMSGGYFAFYNVMLLYTVADFPMWQKCVITFVTNVVGVFIVKYFEERTEKTKLWKIEVTVPTRYKTAVHFDLKNVPHSYIEVGENTLFNFYCNTKAESQKVKGIVNQYEAKYFISEAKASF